MGAQPNNIQVDRRLLAAFGIALMLLVTVLAGERATADRTNLQLQVLMNGALRLVPTATSPPLEKSPQHLQLPAAVTPFFFSPVPINSADRDLLMTLPGIGKGMAERIIAHRREHGPITSRIAFAQIHGIGPKRLEKLHEYISFE